MGEIIANIFINKWVLLSLPLCLFLNILFQPFLLKGKFEKLRKALFILNLVGFVYSSILFIYIIYSSKLFFN
ncbi:hypothetical protein AYJ08_05705 [Brevibacillus sp. SKDU10]|nr:hypothetical protein AYJ08_05705 [Brevibacillus sp. SKDU10]